MSDWGETCFPQSSSPSFSMPMMPSSVQSRNLQHGVNRSPLFLQGHQHHEGGSIQAAPHQAGGHGHGWVLGTYNSWADLCCVKQLNFQRYTVTVWVFLWDLLLITKIQNIHSLILTSKLGWLNASSKKRPCYLLQNKNLKLRTVNWYKHK